MIRHTYYYYELRLVLAGFISIIPVVL